jgi:hypothetical protein
MTENWWISPELFFCPEMQMREADFLNILLKETQLGKSGRLGSEVLPSYHLPQ